MRQLWGGHWSHAGVQPDTGEQALEICEACALGRRGCRGDRLGRGHGHKAEIEGEMGDPMYGLQARLRARHCAS
jgi:RecA/RadA recombinase